MAAIIFDFDGTIADSFDFVIDFLAAESKLKPLNQEQRKLLRGYSMMALARHFGHSSWRMIGLVFRGRRKMTNAIKTIKPFSGMVDVIEKLHAEGHELFIVSSNSVTNVHDFLRDHKLHTYFLEIYGGVGLFGKAPALRRMLKDQNIETKNAVYVGDELRDIEAAQAIQLRVIAVSWGFANVVNLKAAHPTAIAETTDQLLDILEEIE